MANCEQGYWNIGFYSTPHQRRFYYYVPGYEEEGAGWGATPSGFGIVGSDGTPIYTVTSATTGDTLTSRSLSWAETASGTARPRDTELPPCGSDGEPSSDCCDRHETEINDLKSQYEALSNQFAELTQRVETLESGGSSGGGSTQEDRMNLAERVTALENADYVVKNLDITSAIKQALGV